MRKVKQNEVTDDEGEGKIGKIRWEMRSRSLKSALGRATEYKSTRGPLPTPNNAVQPTRPSPVLPFC